MALTKGSGPFGERPAGVFNFERKGPAHVLYFEDSPRRVRVEFGGETLADSRRVKLLHETGLLPVYYFPDEDIRADWLEPTEHRTRCPFKGEARYWSVRTAKRVAENAVWGYPEPLEHAPPIAGYRAFYWDRMDAWYEEDERVFGHPRDPYHRIDVLDTHRRVRVVVGGEVVAETERPRVLFESGLPPRFYVPVADVRERFLEPSDTTTRCAYKGLATYRSVLVGETRVKDALWSYAEPAPEAARIAGYVCFYSEKVDVDVDDEKLPRA
jgi:uncharacterized protein (DUF427 family)